MEKMPKVSPDYIMELTHAVEKTEVRISSVSRKR